jgi:hypothetical protein
MALRSEKRSTASLAGWLFADLSIVLMILFASTGLSSNDVRCEKQEKLSADSPCKKVPASTSTSTTIEPSNGGIRPKPIEVTIDNIGDKDSAIFRKQIENLNPASFQRQIEEKILQQAKSNTELRSASSWDFGVILIYGGAEGRKKSSDGDEIAKIVLKKIAPDKQLQWRKVRDTTFYEPGHDMSLPYGFIKLKLFPIISE